ncbi:MAG: hypothetical protein AAGG68_23535 [Bacteroidota bacterium]
MTNTNHLHETFENAVYTLWITDIWLTKSSFQLAGVFSNQVKAVEYAKTEALLADDGHVVIYKGRLDHYEASEEKVFSTEFDKDRALLSPTPEK